MSLGSSAGAATGTATAMGEVRAREAKSERSAKDFMLAIVVAIDCA
jgi:cation transporter-like permease